jgi:hypothetical protein
MSIWRGFENNKNKIHGKKQHYLLLLALHKFTNLNKDLYNSLCKVFELLRYFQCY